MSCDWLQQALPYVRQLTPYQPGKPLAELEREYGIRGAIKLASNESPLGPSPLALAALREVANAEGVARYPDGGGFALKHALSEHLHLPPEWITLGNGSNDVLELIARAFAGPGHSIVYSQYAFAVYPLAAQVVGAQPVAAPAHDWGHDLAAMHAALRPDTKVVFIANPNNPTGTWLTRIELRNFLADVPESVAVVIDEAYAEYVDHAAYPNALEWLGDFPNLIVTRTFSKAYGLAGLRVGYAIASPTITGVLNRVRQPFNVNTLAMTAAIAALQDSAHLAQAVALNQVGMRQWEEGLAALGVDYIPSLGNFITVQVHRPGGEVYEAMLRQGVIVRPLGNYGMPTHLRISIGTQAENARGLQALQQALAST